MFDGPLRDALHALVKELKSLRETITTKPTPLATPKTYCVRVPIGKEFLWPTTKDCGTGTYVAVQEISLDLGGDFVVRIVHKDAPVLTLHALAFRFRPVQFDSPAVTAMEPLSIKIELDEGASVPPYIPPTVAMVINGMELKTTTECVPPLPYYGPLSRPLTGLEIGRKGRR